MAGFGFEDVAVFGGYGVDAEVPDAEVDLFIGDDFHKGELAKVERGAEGYLHPVTSREELGGGFDDFVAAVWASEVADFEAGYVADAGADVSTDDDVTAVGGASGGGSGGLAGCSVGVDDEGCAASGGRCS